MVKSEGRKISGGGHWTLVSALAARRLGFLIFLLFALSSGSTWAATQTVSIGDNFFSPRDLAITAGDTVFWRNTGSVKHNVRAISAAFVSVNLYPGVGFYAGSNLPVGTYRYYCSLHTGHTGSIIVQAANTATITSPTNNSTFIAPATVSVEATVSDSVISVVFALIGPAGSIGDTDTVAPFQFTAVNLPAGNYTATATPVNSQGVEGTPASVSFTVAGPAQLCNPILLPDGRIQFTIIGVAGQEYELQATSALTGGWTAVLSVTTPGIDFPFAEALDQEQRFYRVVTR